jgi:hypothetical protein
MTSPIIKKNLSVQLTRLKKLKGVLIKSGNGERSNTFLMNLYAILKQGFRGKSVTTKYQLTSFGETKPLAIIDRCLYKLMPAFILRRVIKSGKSFELPVPISDNHAFFMACNWLSKASLKNNKSALTIPYLLTQEICATLYNEGAALDYLKAYIEIALDQRPFMRYVKKKRKIISRSKKSYAAYRLRKIYHKQQSTAFQHRNHTTRNYKRINTHSLRRNASIVKRKQNIYKKKFFSSKRKTFSIPYVSKNKTYR